jgi:hypothetical protein
MRKTLPFSAAKSNLSPQLKAILRRNYLSRAFSSEVDTGSREENAKK